MCSGAGILPIGLCFLAPLWEVINLPMLLCSWNRAGFHMGEQLTHWLDSTTSSDGNNEMMCSAFVLSEEARVILYFMYLMHKNQHHLARAGVDFYGAHLSIR